MEASLPVVECFHSVQGEGAHVGRSAFFIRLASCNVKCSWCDTKESWSIDNHPQVPLPELAKKTIKAVSQGAAFVVITGGEPLHHDLSQLCKELRDAMTINSKECLPIHLETSGVNPLSGNPNWITLAPKRHAPPRIDLLGSCQELKVVIHESKDLIFAEEMAEKTNSHSSRDITKDRKKALLFLQPGWGSNEANEIVFDYVKSHPKWRLSLQTHKWLGVM